MSKKIFEGQLADRLLEVKAMIENKNKEIENHQAKINELKELIAEVRIKKAGLERVKTYNPEYVESETNQLASLKKSAEHELKTQELLLLNIKKEREAVVNEKIEIKIGLKDLNSFEVSDLQDRLNAILQ